MVTALGNLASEVDKVAEFRLYGRVTAVLGMMVEVGGVDRALSIGVRLHLQARGGKRVSCEIVGFKDGRALAMPFGALDGIGIGSRAEISDAAPVVYPHDGWLGRDVNARGEPVDGKGPLGDGTRGCPIKSQPPAAHTRQRVGEKLDLGIRAINTFISVCRGQRMGYLLRLAQIFLHFGQLHRK